VCSRWIDSNVAVVLATANGGIRGAVLPRGVRSRQERSIQKALCGARMQKATIVREGKNR